MANPYFTKGSVPASNASGVSSVIRTEFSAIAAGFDKFPTLNAGSLIRVNSGGTALTSGGWPTSDFLGGWTPTLTFDTPGNLSISYSQQFAVYGNFGPLDIVHFQLSTSSFTHTTASGNARITGFFESNIGGSSEVYMGPLFVSGVNTVFTSLHCYMAGGANYFTMSKVMTGSTPGFLDVSNFPTGNTIYVWGLVVFRARA